MVDPRLALAVFAALVLLLALACWPRVGLVARLARVAGRTERVRLEDALKHLVNSELAGRPASLESLAGALECSRASASRLAARLAELDLARVSGAGFALTEQGRAYGLRIVRTHRLWERFLADRTGVAPGEWHDEAERLEHRLSPAETDALSATLGHPLVDPHGDPIPTAAGELPEGIGIALGALAPGRAGRVVHVEDEPRDAYDRLVARGIARGAVVTRLEAPGGRVRLRLDGAEEELDPLAAAGVTVEPLGEGEEPPVAAATLAALRPGESATVRGIAPTCQGPQRRRLLDLGVVPGTVIVAEFASASGDPIAYRIRGALIALRRQQAAWIQVEAPSVDARRAG